MAIETILRLLIKYYCNNPGRSISYPYSVDCPAVLNHNCFQDRLVIFQLVFTVT